MDQLSIQTIENFLGVPLIAPAAIHELDAKEIAAALDRIDDDRIAALGETEDAWEKPEVQDELNRERLGEITDLLEAMLAHCEICQAGEVCVAHVDLRLWLSEA